MATHFKKCFKRSATEPVLGDKAPRCFHIVVGATYDPAYWLHLELPATVTFGRLDQVLRDLWLECCGHLSTFRFPRKQVRPSAPMAFAQIFKQFRTGGYMDEPDDGEQIMDERLGKRLQSGMKFDYEYDFGSTTNLSLRVMADYVSLQSKPKIRLLARNEPPDIPCARCGKPATQLCVECEGTPLCDACVSEHECGEEMLMPLLNSPRAGVCGYCGPSVEP